MNVNETVSCTSGLSGAAKPASRLTRWCTLGCLALALSAGVTAWTGTASYEEQLGDILAARGFSEVTYNAIHESPPLRQLFRDAVGDRELTLKLELALLKHQDRARRVLEAFGADPQFQEILLRHGEVVVPVIDYFMVNEVATLWAQSKVATAKEYVIKLFAKKTSKAADAEKLVYGPRLRGISAIETIRADGYHFLGQFVFDKNNQAQRVQTDRVLEVLKDLFTSGVTDLESKYRSGNAISLPDVAWAGADVLSVFGVTKAVKYLGKGAVSVKAAEEAAVVGRRTSLMGRSVLIGEKVGTHVAKLGAKVAAVYLVLRHPSLLSGVFGAVGKLLDIPAWMAILIGWWGVALAAMLVILPVLRGVTLLIPPIQWIAGAAAWALPKRTQPAINSAAA